MNIFNKKFKVKVSHVIRDKYKVQYAHYRFIPTWHSLCFWFELTLTGNRECWSPKLMNIEEAERLAKRINSMEDVTEFYKPDEEREKIFYERKEQYYKKAVPYQSKEF